MKFRNHIILLLLFLTAALFAADVNVYFENIGNATIGEEFSIPIKTDSILTDLNVYSFQFRVTYDSNRFDFVDIDTDSTLCDGFGSIMVNSQTPGVIQIAGAGTSPLEGTGRILKLKFNPINTGYTYFNFNGENENFFNEGTPSASFQSGYYNIYEAPQLDVYPDSEILAVGQTLQMNISGSYTGLITWSVNDGNLATISETGLLTTLAAGNVIVTATDEANISGTNQGILEIRPISLIPEDTEVFQTNQVNIPMTVSDLTGLGVSSAQFNILLGDDLECVGISTENTVAANSNAEYQNYGNYVQVSLAGAQAWSGSGTLFELQVEAVDNDYGNRTIRFESGFFNEDILFYTEDGHCQINQLPSLTITPNYFEIFAGNSIQLSVSDNATLPVVWSSSNEEVAIVDETGLMTALRSGNVIVSVEDDVNATGEISNITIFDGKLNINQTYAEPQAQVKVPVSVEDLDIAKAFSSFEMQINYRNPELDFVEIENQATVCENWAFTVNENDNQLNIAAAGTTDVHDGILFYLVFNTTEYLTINENAYVNIQSTMFNEGFPILKNYNSNVTGHPVLNVNFSVADTVVNMNSNVQFTDLSTGNPISWEWDFDNDGIVDATEQNPVWQYADPGIYSVKLTVASLAAKRSEIKEQYIEVLEGLSLLLPSDGIYFEEDGSIENHDFLQYVQNIDPLTDSLTLSVSGNSHIHVEIDSLSVTFTSDENWSGFEELTFQLNDHLADRMIASDVMNVIVDPVNDAPILVSNIPDVAIDEDTQTQIEFVEYFNDVDIPYGDVLEYGVSSTAFADAYILDNQLFVTPDENWYGDLDFVVTATDQGGLSVSDTIIVAVNPINDRPVINAPENGFFFLEDESLDVNLAEMITDVDNDFAELNIEITGNQNVITNITGTNLHLSATENWFGSENLIFTVNDVIASRNSRETQLPVVDTILTVVESVDDLPTINLPEEIAFRFDDSIDFDLDPYTEDVDGPSVNVSFDPVDSLEIVQNGLVFNISSINEWIGSVYVTFHVTDITGAPVNSDSVLVRSTNENIPPSLNLPESLEFEEDGSLIVDLINEQYLTDPDSDQFTVEVVGGTNISCNVSETSLTFTSTENWYGSELFFVTATDDSLDSAMDSVMIVVYPADDDPELDLPAEFTFNEDDSLLVDFSEYITEYDDDPHSISLISSSIDSIHADVEGTAVEFTAEPNWFGNGTFVFQVHDDLARDIRMDTVLVTVLSVNDAPELTMPTSYEFNEDETVEFDLSDYVSDIDNDVADLVLTFTGNDNINLALNNFILTVSAGSNWNGEEVVTFTLSDEVATSRNARSINSNREQTSVDVTFYCSPINDEPQLDLPEVLTFNEDETLDVDFSEYILEVDGDPHSVSLVESGIDSIHVDIDGMNVEFSAETNWNGSGSFVFEVQDDLARDIRIDTVLVTVLPVNDAPEFTIPATYEFNEDETVQYDVSGFIADIDNDVADLSLTFSGNDHINLSLTGFVLSVSAEADWTGSEVVTFVLSDETTRCRNSRSRNANREQVSVDVTFTCLPINDTPEIIQNFTDLVLDEDFADQTYDLSEYFMDPDGDNLEFTAEYNDEHIIVEINGSDVTISSILNWNGSTTITFTADDGVNETRNSRNNNRDSVQNSLAITVNPVNDAPVINSFIPTETEFDYEGDLSASLGFSVEASDVDSELEYSWTVEGIDQDNDTDSLNITLDQTDDYVVICTVSDGSETLMQEWLVHLTITENELPGIPVFTELKGNYPNPFNPTTTIKYTLNKDDNVKVVIYNVKGQIVRTIVDEKQEAGSHSVIWKGQDHSGNNVASGIYFYRMETSSYSKINKMILMK